MDDEAYAVDRAIADILLVRRIEVWCDRRNLDFERANALATCDPYHESRGNGPTWYSEVAYHSLVPNFFAFIGGRAPPHLVATAIHSK